MTETDKVVTGRALTRCMAPDGVLVLTGILVTNVPLPGFPSGKWYSSLVALDSPAWRDAAPCQSAHTPG